MTNIEKTAIHRMLAEMTAAGVVEATCEIGATVYLEESQPHLPPKYKAVKIPTRSMKLAHALWKEHGSVPEAVWRSAGFEIIEENDVPYTEELKRLVYAAGMIAAGVALYEFLPDPPASEFPPRPTLLLALHLEAVPLADGEPIPQDEIVSVHTIWENNGIEGLIKWLCERRGVEYQPGLTRY